MLDAGKFDKFVTVEQRTDTRSASGAVVPSWSTYLRAWAQSLYRGGREFVAAAQMHSDLDAVFVIRAGAWGVTNQMRVNYGGRYFDILSVDDLSDRDRVRLICREGQRQGS